MKTITKLAFALIIISIAFASCKKTKNATPVGALGPNFPYIINTIITPAILDTLENHGLIVHNGLTPAAVNGIYLFSPDECLYDNSDHYYVGQIIDNYKYKFSNQNNSAFTISVEYKDLAANNNIGSDNTATYISGTGNNFTIFAQIQGVLNGVSYTSLEIYSGVISSSGIVNFQNALYLKSKVGDANNASVAPIGTIRLFADQDALSATQSTFSINGQQIQSINPELLKSILSVTDKSKLKVLN